MPLHTPGLAASTLLSLPAVTGNGTCLYDFSQNREIRSFPMPQEAVGDLAGYLKAHAPTCGLRASTENGFLIECVNNRFIQEDIRRFGMENIRILPQKEWRAKCYYKLAQRRVSPFVYCEVMYKLICRACVIYLIKVCAVSKTHAFGNETLLVKQITDTRITCVYGL